MSNTNTKIDLVFKIKGGGRGGGSKTLNRMKNHIWLTV